MKLRPYAPLLVMAAAAALALTLDVRPAEPPPPSPSASAPRPETMASAPVSNPPPGLQIGLESPALAGNMPALPNVFNCAPLPSQAWIPDVDGSAWKLLTSGSGTPGFACVGVDYQLYVLGCRIGPGGNCSGVPSLVQVQRLWADVWP